MRKLLLPFSLVIFVVLIYLYGHPISEFIYAEAEEIKNSQMLEPNNFDFDAIKVKQIEEDNILYKDRVFGNIFRGLAMSISPEYDEYEIGNKIEISCLFKNFSREFIFLYRLRDDDQRDFRYAFYFTDGRPVPKSEYAEKFEAIFDKPLSRSSEYGFRFSPQEIKVFIILVDRFFKIEKEGTYFLVMMRRITDSWQDGFMISNMTKINIVKKKTEKQG